MKKGVRARGREKRGKERASEREIEQGSEREGMTAGESNIAVHGD